MNTYDKTVSSRARAESFGLTEHFTEWELIEILKTADYQCQKCGRSADSVTLSVDHIVPLDRGGSNTKDNIQILCRSCNASKHDKIKDYRNIPDPIQDDETSHAAYRTKKRETRIKTKASTYIPLMVRLPSDLHAVLSQKAASSNLSLNQMIIAIMSKHFGLKGGYSTESNISVDRTAEMSARLSSLEAKVNMLLGISSES